MGQGTALGVPTQSWAALPAFIWGSAGVALLTVALEDLAKHTGDLIQCLEQQHPTFPVVVGMSYDLHPLPHTHPRGQLSWKLVTAGLAIPCGKKCYFLIPVIDDMLRAQGS